MAEITRRRGGQLIRGVFAILRDHPDGLQAKLVLAELATRVPPTPFEDSFYEDRPNVRRYEKIVRFSTIGPVKAGWLEKNKGLWFVTDAGQAALQRFSDPEEFMREAHRLYQAWAQDQPPRPEEPVEEEEEEVGTSALFEEAEESAWSEIEQHLGRMHPYDFQQLVAGLLRGMGYFVAWVAPPGPDMGVDILAHSDPLGIRGPRIKVQVKRQADKTTVTGVRSFLSVLGEGDVGLFVAIGGFTKDAEETVRAQEKRRLMLLDLRRLFDLWVEHYAKIPEEVRRLLPLRAIHFLAPTE
jgi:restriction system protein